jgi:O-antigen/teichoic acid export membrane protein
MSSSKNIFNIKILSKLFSDDNLTKKASLNAIASALDYGSRLIVGFLVQPIMVSGLGDYYYGVWQILLRMIGYITPAGGRPSQALKMSLANKHITAADDEKRRLVGSSLIVWAIFLPIMAILGGLITWFVPYWIKSPSEYYWTIRVTSAILVINLIVSNIATIPESALEGENLGYKRMGLSSLLVFVGGGLTWLAIWLQTGIVGVGIATFIVTLLTGVFFLWVMRDYAPWFGSARPSAQAVIQFLGLSWWFLAWNLIMNLMTASDVVILGVLVSVQTVTDYSLSKYAAETLISIVAIMAFGIAPGLGGIIGSGNYKKAINVRGEIMALTWLIVTVLGTMVLMWNRSFLSLWVGSQHFIGSIPDLLIVIVVMQFIFIRNDGNVIDLTLRLKNKVIMGAISVGVSLGIAVAFIQWLNLGVVGICLGLIIGRLILSVGYPILVGRFLGISFLAQVKSTFKPVFLTALFFILATLFDRYIVVKGFSGIGGWIQLSLYVSITLLGAMILTFYIGLTSQQRNNILQRVRIVLNFSKD